MEQGLAASGSYFQYTLVNTTDKQLKAVMIIEDGTVNIDQLGAKGDAVLPASYNDTIGSVDSCNARTRKTLNINNGSTEQLNENEVAITATDNADYFNKAISNEQVHCVRLTAGKIYGTKKAINMQSDKVLDGNGATIMNIEATPESNYFYLINCRYHDVTKVVFFDNIEIKNVRLIHNSLFGNNCTYRAIYIQHCRNVNIHDVTIERSHVGIKATATNKGVDFNTISISNVHISDVFMGIEFGDAEKSTIKDTYISCNYNLFLDEYSARRKHCIYAGGCLKDCLFEDLTLVNIGEGCAINRNHELICENLTFNNIIIDNCHCAIHIGKRTHNSVFKNIIATNIRESGIALCGAENVLITNCSFRGTDEAACGILIPSDSNTNDYVINVVIDNCNFDFRHKFFWVGEGRTVTGDNMTVESCYFHIDLPQLSQKLTPAFIKGIVSNVSFVNCIFETDGFSDDDHSKNGVFFYFSSERVIPMHWTFDRCKFINNGIVTVNSPVLSNRACDEEKCDNNNVCEVTKTVHCTMKNCTLVNFRWTIRVSTTGESRSVDTNPCFYPPGEGENVSVDAAVKAMNNKQRFIAINNIHQYDEIIDGFNTTHYVKGVDFGI